MTLGPRHKSGVKAEEEGAGAGVMGRDQGEAARPPQGEDPVLRPQALE